MEIAKLLQLFKLTNDTISAAATAKPAKHMSLMDAFATMSLPVIQLAVETQGFSKSVSFYPFLIRAMHTENFGVMRFMLENKGKLFGDEPLAFFQSMDPERFVDKPRVIDVMFEYAHCWRDGAEYIIRFTEDQMMRTKNEREARIYLKRIFPNHLTVRAVESMTMPCRTTTFAKMLIAAAGTISDECALSCAKLLFRRAVSRHEMPMLRFLMELMPALRGSLSDEWGWFIIMLLAKPLTPQRKEVLIYAMETVFLAKDEIAYALYILDDADLILQPEPVEMDVEHLVNPHREASRVFHPDDFLNYVLNISGNNIPDERLQEMITQHISDKQRIALRHAINDPRRSRARALGDRIRPFFS